MATNRDIELEERLARLLEERNKTRQEELAELNEQLALVKELEKAGDSMLGIDKRKLEFRRELIKLQEEEERLQRLREAGNEEAYQLGLRKLVQDKENLGVMEEMSSKTDSVLQLTFGLSDAATKFGLNLQNPLAAFAGIGKSIQQINSDAAFGAIAFNSLQLALAQDKAAVSFNVATSQAGTFTSQIAATERELFNFGISSDDAQKSLQSLFNNFTDFTELLPSQQKEVAKTTAVLQKFGVANETTAQNIQFATNALGMGTTAAVELQRELFVFAQELGVSGQQIASDFQQFGPQIAALGSEGVDAFKALAAQAKSTGLELQALVTLTDQFNKFDTAAQSVGKLNALLGGPFLNTLELVNETNPARRMELLKDALDDAGASFDSMDFFQRKALASAMGLNEAQLAMLMRGSLDRVMPTPKTAAELEELQLQSQNFNSILEELTQTAKAFVIGLQPVIMVAKDIIDLLTRFKAVTSLLTAALIVYKTVQFGVNTALGIYNLILAVTSVRLQAAVVRTFMLYRSQGILRAATLATAMAFRMMGISANMALGVFGLILTAVLGLAYVFYTKAASPGFITILGLVAAGFIAMGVAATVFGFSLAPVLPFILAFAAAIMMVGLGIGIASAGLSLMVTSLGDFGTGLAESMMVTAIAIADIVESINELDTVKAVALTATTVATGVAGSALAAVGLAATAVAPAAPAAGAAAEGPAPVINVSLNIDGTEFSTAVNKVEVERFADGKRGDMYESIIGQLEKGLQKG